jgi:fatty-acyl-CoA synthase
MGGNLNFLVSGGAPISPEILSWMQNMGLNVFEVYGLTESSGLISVNLADDNRLGSVGKVLPDTEMRLAVDGEILTRGDHVCQGYLGDQEATSELISDDGWLSSGDIGRVDEDGYLWITGRAKDIIIRGGHNIDPETIEEPLNAHPEVSIAIAVGLPDPYTGELPMAYVVTTIDSKISEGELLDYCKQEISERAAIPKRIIFVEAMPLTVIGKVFRPLLRQMISETIISEHLLSESIPATVSSEIEKKRGLVLKIVVNDKGGIETANKLLSGYTFTVEVS